MLVHLSRFQNDMSDARGMVSSAQQKDSAGAYVWHSAARSMFIESSFMKIFIAWELFQEQTFISYMLGNASMRGTVITRYVTPLDSNHANDLLLGGNGRFADWSTPDVVRRMARLCFANGDPYETALAAIHSDLLDLKTIRNAASHISSTTTSALDALASRKLQTPMSGCSVASLLLAIDPNSAAGDSFLTSYCNLLDAAANLIANA